MPSLGGFRAKAVFTLQSPEQLDRPIRIVGPKNWIALSAILALLAGVVVWAAISYIPTSVSAGGFVTPAGGWSGIEAPFSGIVQSTALTVGSAVKPGSVLAVIDDQAGNVLRSVHAISKGYVAEVSVAPGQYVSAGEQLAIMTPSSTSLVVRAFFPVSTVQEIIPGTAVKIGLSSLPSEGYGYIRGRVQSVAPLAATEQGLEDVLQNPALVSEVEERGPVVEVVVVPTRAHTVSGFGWTLGRGPAFPALTGGLPVHVSIMLYRQHPIKYVV